MIYLLIFLYMIFIPAIVLILLFNILYKLEDIKYKSNYTSIVNDKETVLGYEKYKNKEGLYEPITPNCGIKIKKKEE